MCLLIFVILSKFCYSYCNASHNPNGICSLLSHSAPLILLTVRASVLSSRGSGKRWSTNEMRIRNRLFVLGRSELRSCECLLQVFNLTMKLRITTQSHNCKSISNLQFSYLLRSVDASLSLWSSSAAKKWLWYINILCSHLLQLLLQWAELVSDLV